MKHRVYLFLFALLHNYIVYSSEPENVPKLPFFKPRYSCVPRTPQQGVRQGRGIAPSSYAHVVQSIQESKKQRVKLPAMDLHKLSQRRESEQQSGLSPSSTSGNSPSSITSGTSISSDEFRRDGCSKLFVNEWGDVERVSFPAGMYNVKDQEFVEIDNNFFKVTRMSVGTRNYILLHLFKFRSVG